jgi:hypothetical protein
MSFLSLGLQDDELQACSGPNLGEVIGNAPATDDSTLSDCLIQGHSENPLTTEGLTAEDNSGHVQVSTLPSAIKEVSKKISGNANKPALRTIVSDGTPTFTTFKFGYLPGRALLCSIIAHEIAMFGLFLFVHYGLVTFHSQKLIVQINSNDHVIYLPEIGGGKEGEKSPGGGPSEPKQASAAPAHGSKGFAYPARQAILSDPPNPTNAFQTLQRPLIVHPLPLNKLVPLPNIVQMAETRLPSDLLAPKPAMPQFHPVPKPIRVKHDANLHREAQWKVPVNDPPQLVAKIEMPKLPAAEQPLPEAPKIQRQPKQEEENREVEKPSPKPIKVTAEKRAEKSTKEVAPLTSAQVARMEMHGKTPEPLLVLSPMPLPPGTNAKIPNAEARGRFALAPGGTLNPNSLTPGKMNVSLSTSPGMGQDKSQAANAATAVASNAGNGVGHAATANGGSGNSTDASGSGSAGSGIGAGNTSGEGAGGTGAGKGRGSMEKGSGATSGRGTGTGSGGGGGLGSGAFQGITIQGGEQGGGDPPAFTIAQQHPYGITVVSTASSGGGLGDYGVFNNERVFTVYLPMKRSPEAEDPTWTLQYSLSKGHGVEGAGDQAVLAPQPVMREWPQFPADLEKKYAQRQVVLYAMVDKDGKISHVLVKQTPDPRVSDPIVQALAKWVFRPAQLNNQPFAVKVLLGIPL